MIQQILCYFDTNGEAEYRCECGYINKIKIIKPNNNEKGA